MLDVEMMVFAEYIKHEVLHLSELVENKDVQVGYILVGTDENNDVTRRLTMLGMNEVRILSVDVEEVFEHLEDKTRYCKDFCKGTEPELAWYGYDQRDCQQSKEYPPLLTP